MNIKSRIKISIHCMVIFKALSFTLMIIYYVFFNDILRIYNINLQTKTLQTKPLQTKITYINKIWVIK